MDRKEQKLVNFLKKNNGSVVLEIPYYIGRLGIKEVSVNKYGYAAIRVVGGYVYNDIDEFYIQSETDMTKCEFYNEILRSLTD